MHEFERERAHRGYKDMSHLKDEVDEKNTEHIDAARRTDEEAGDETRDNDTPDAGPEDDSAPPPPDRRP